jgi:predicted ATPase
LLSAGDVASAETLLQEAFALVDDRGERGLLSMLHRVDGLVAVKRTEPDLARAEACFLEAIDIAHRQEARMYELAAACDLARLWRDTGLNLDRRALLEPILATIEGGEAHPIVRNGRALLAELA